MRYIDTVDISFVPLVPLLRENYRLVVETFCALKVLVLP